MRIKTFIDGGFSDGGFTNPGGTLTGPLVLVGTPLVALEAATKDYADIKFVPHAIDNTAHLTTTQNNLLDGISVSLAEINSVSGLTGSAQTQVNGLANLSGANFTGFITLHADPTANLHAATKQYVDNNLINAGLGVPVGDVIKKAVDVTPVGFLRANGALADKTTYSALFAVIGETFLGFNPLGAGKPWKQQYDINLTQSTDITGWVIGTSFPAAVRNSQAIVTKNRVYMLGGWNGSVVTSTVYTAIINTNGTLGTWSLGTSLLFQTQASQAIVTKNRVYLLGGFINGVNSAIVQTAPINIDGTLGTWTTGTSLPGTVSWSQAIVTKNRVYLLGGFDGVDSAVVYTAPISINGTLGTWSTGTPLPVAIRNTQAIVTKNRVYLLGGLNNGAASAVVYTAPINIDGTLGTWTTGTSLPALLREYQAIVTKNRVYLLGGSFNGVDSAVVHTAPINTDGTLGTWTTGTSLPGTVILSQAIVTKNRVYLFGGWLNSVTSAVVWSAPILEGLNDYSPYYDGTILAPIDPNNFTLPDYTLADATFRDGTSYIKA